MKRRKFLLGSSALLTSGAFMTGTGAFSSAELDRGVDVAVASDEDAYLALTTDEEGNPTVGLFSADGPFEAPKTITVANQLGQALTVTIESRDNITIDGKGRTEFDLGIGEAADVVVDLVGNEPIKAELEISARGDGVQINATRRVEMEPGELTAQIALKNVNAPLKIQNINNVNQASVVVRANGSTFDTAPAGNSNNLKIVYDDPAALGCGSPGDSISLTVEGQTTDGIPFSGSVSGVNCAASGENSDG